MKERRIKERRIKGNDLSHVEDDPKSIGSMPGYSLDKGESWYRDNRSHWIPEARRECDRKIYHKGGE